MDTLLSNEEVSNLILKNCEKYSINKLQAMEFINHDDEINDLETMRDVLSYLDSKSKKESA